MVVFQVLTAYTQCPNLLDGLGKKHGYWCEYRKESRWVLDTINVLVAEGNYIHGKKQGEWKYYPVFKNSDIVGNIHRVIYYPDSGIFIKSGISGEFISEDSSYLVKVKQDNFADSYCFRTNSASYICIRRFQDECYYYKKDAGNFEEAYIAIRSRWKTYEQVKLKKNENPPGLR